MRSLGLSLYLPLLIGPLAACGAPVKLSTSAAPTTAIPVVEGTPPTKPSVPAVSGPSVNVTPPPVTPPPPTRPDAPGRPIDLGRSPRGTDFVGEEFIVPPHGPVEFLGRYRLPAGSLVTGGALMERIESGRIQDDPTVITFLQIEGRAHWLLATVLDTARGTRAIVTDAIEVTYPSDTSGFLHFFGPSECKSENGDQASLLTFVSNGDSASPSVITAAWTVNSAGKRFVVVHPASVDCPLPG
jgi:hypothetical protein